MDREKLEQTFRWKITAEMGLFKEHMMRMEKEGIFAAAYRIDCTIRIYEILLEICGRMGNAELEACMGIGGILDFLYGMWLKEPDTQEAELEHSLCSAIKNITESFGKDSGTTEISGKDSGKHEEKQRQGKAG